MRVLVTGGAGFIGQHLVARLVESPLSSEGQAAGAAEPVVVFDNLKRSSRAALEPLIAAGTVRFIEGDIREQQAVAEAMAGVDVVFHLAAQANVIGSEADPDYAFHTNVTGTYHVLRAAAKVGAQRVLFASSREVYGQPSRLPVTEDMPIAPKNLYGASKASAEMQCRAEVTRSGLEVIALRLSNVYGFGDRDRVLPIWLERAARGEDLVLFGGGQVLDLIWVGDVVDAFVRAAVTPRLRLAAEGLIDAMPPQSGFFVAINIGSGQGTPLRELAYRVQELMPHPVGMRVEAARAVEVERFIADNALARYTLDLRPDTALAHLPEMARYYAQAAHTTTRLTPQPSL